MVEKPLALYFHVENSFFVSSEHKNIVFLLNIKILCVIVFLFTSSFCEPNLFF